MVKVVIQQISGHFEGERVGMLFPLLNNWQNTLEWRSHCYYGE